MKKFLAMFLVIMTLASIALPSALADGDTTPYQFTFTALCKSKTSPKNHSNNFKTKTADCTIIEVRYSVSGNGSDAGYTNLISAYVNGGSYYGSAWHAPDMVFHSCTSPSLHSGLSVAPGGRGNTKYYENLGLTSITITGQFRPH